MKALTCACDNEPLCGIEPASMAALMFDLLANTSACVVNGPPELELPKPWQLLFIEQTVVRIGCTSVENFGLIPTQEKEIPAPPLPEGVLLLQDIKSDVAEKIRGMIAIVFFIAGEF